MQYFNLRLAAELGGRKLTALHAEAMRGQTAMIVIFVNAFSAGRRPSVDQRERDMRKAQEAMAMMTKARKLN